MTEKIGMITGNINRIKSWVNKKIRVEGFNTFVGTDAGDACTGEYNTYVGFEAGKENVSGEFNTCIGYKAGKYDTGTFKLYIDAQNRSTEAEGKTKSMVYGEFHGDPANQMLRLNAIIELTQTPEYANNAAAVTGGMAVNQIYKSGDLVKIVHA